MEIVKHVRDSFHEISLYVFPRTYHVITSQDVVIQYASTGTSLTLFMYLCSSSVFMYYTVFT